MKIESCCEHTISYFEVLAEEDEEYVCGFLFNPEKTKVALIRKNRPEWQKGFFNGIGGKIEETDSDKYHSMSREFLEETGVIIDKSNWDYFCKIEGSDWMVHFFHATSDQFDLIETITDEYICKYPIEVLWNSTNVIPNLKWLIPMCYDPSHNFAQVASR
jgi:8-oxo-dGTP diphosphatase